MKRGKESVDNIMGGGITGESRRHHWDKIRVRVEIGNKYQRVGL